MGDRPGSGDAGVNAADQIVQEMLRLDESGDSTERRRFLEACDRAYLDSERKRAMR